MALLVTARQGYANSVFSPAPAATTEIGEMRAFVYHAARLSIYSRLFLLLDWVVDLCLMVNIV